MSYSNSFDSPKNIHQTEATVVGSFTRTFFPRDLPFFFNKGILIDRRNNTPMEMDAYSLYLALKAIEQVDHVDYRAERKTIVDAVITRMQSCNGFWNHGAWTGSSKEVHMRFTSAALRLLIEALGDGLLEKPLVVLDAVKKHLSFTDELNCGTWFLHDSLELAETGVPKPKGPDDPILNHAWGSSAINCMVLNTHVDTLATMIYVLQHLEMGELDRQHLLSKVYSGLSALSTVLAPHKTLAGRCFARVDAICRSYFFGNYFNRSLLARLLKRGLVTCYYPIRQRVRSWLPFYVFPDGYTERDISLYGLCFHYHVVNVFDLARLLRQTIDAGVVMDDALHHRCRQIIDNGIDYAVCSTYWNHLTTEMLKNGTAILLCEAILARLGTLADHRLPQHWVHAYCVIRRSLPPTPAILGYDPFIVQTKEPGLKCADGWDAVCLRNGARLEIDLVHERAVISSQPGGASIPIANLAT